MVTRFARAAFVAGVAVLLAAAADAQPLGTFSWQLQPFCNVVTVNLTQQGAVYTMDGFDDQCGAPQRAALVGLATPNADGSIAVGLNLVTAPGGRGVQVAARFTLPSASGTWSDSAGNAGTLALGASTGGAARPLPAAAAAIPGAFSLLNDGGFLAGGTLGAGAIPASGSGARLMWHPGKSAFRAGSVAGEEWDDANVGVFSTAFGFSTTANGIYSTAAGIGTTASGRGSTAFGEGARASNDGSSAFGNGTTASGRFSTAMGSGSMAGGLGSVAGGRSTTANGEASLAMGFATRAIGNFSTAFGNASMASGSGSLVAGTSSGAGGVDAFALGLRVNANGAGNVVLGSDATSTTTGNFMYGDRSTTNDLTTFGSNEFLVRAAGGTVFYSNAAMTTGVLLTAGGGGWSNLSDVNMKTEFRDLDGEQVLGKLAAMPVREWSYTTQDASIRHVGPTAQAFHAAFGLGESDVRIGTVDADGIALAGVKALEARTRATNDALAQQNELLTREVADLRARLARLETLLDKR